MSDIRLGIIGLGGMGRGHAKNLLDGKVPGLRFAAGTDINPKAAEAFPEIPFFPTPEALIASGTVDAILIVTPHWSHVPLGIAALRAGVHVLVEKPIAVHRADADKLVAARKEADPKLVFAAMFNQRTDPYYIAIRELVRGGGLGALRRVTWTITDWFRSDAYYASGSWRATWQGEGGGVLLNQCPHNLDLLSWMFGQPKRVRSFCAFGRHHPIEVEDDVTAYLEFEGGATGLFVTSTGEAPGSNRLEVAGDRGKLVMEGDSLVFTENAVPTSEWCRTTKEGFSRPHATVRTIPAEGHGEQHIGIFKNFAAAIQGKEPLIAPAEEGVFSVELANAMLLSTWEDRTIDLPLDGARYEKALMAKIAASPKSKK